VFLIDELNGKLEENNLELEEVDKDKAEIKGIVACKGNVKGKVRLILSKDQLRDFQEGEILVTEMTSPQKFFHP